MKMSEEKVIKRALLPNLSIRIPRIGLDIAEIKYGIENSFPAVVLSKWYLVWRRSEQI